MLSFLHRWGYCWKCEFVKDVKLEQNFYHNDGEQLGFYEKVYLKTQIKKKDVLVIFILQETKNSNLFNKIKKELKSSQENLTCHLNNADLHEQ